MALCAPLAAPVALGALLMAPVALCAPLAAPVASCALLMAPVALCAPLMPLWRSVRPGVVLCCTTIIAYTICRNLIENVERVKKLKIIYERPGASPKASVSQGHIDKPNQNICLWAR